MCGIAGYIGSGSRSMLDKMIHALKHRGPDDEGFYVDNGVGLGHCRLSIIDLISGHQPISNESKTVWLVANCEIYNFKELRKELISQRHKFYTYSDAETIVHLYEEYGEEFLNKLNGMFSFALWDNDKKKLILARDRLGQKPLYYSIVNQSLVFSSELKAILEYSFLKKDIDWKSLAKYLIYEYIPSPHTIFKNIYKLGPGEYIVYQDGNLVIKKYWEVSFNKYSKEITKQEYLSQLDEKIDEAVSIRLMADVPLGIFLSGGIDSTSIAYYAQKKSLNKIKTFSIGFSDKSFDESDYSRQAAKFLQTEHYEQILEPKDCLGLIPKISDFLDEPFADPSIIPTYLLSKFTKKIATIALGGDGGDELFMGYPTFQAHRLDRIYQRIPAWVRYNLINPLINNLPVSLNNISLDFKLKKFVTGFEYCSEIKNQIWLGSFLPGQLEKIFINSIYQEIKTINIFEDIRNYVNSVRNQRLGNRLIYLYLKNYLQDDILVKVDRASMASSLEVRAPFLDYQLVDFINSIPLKYKLRGWQSKYLLKELMKDKLPKNIVYRSKKGFGIPVAKWIKADLRDFVLDIFSKSKIEREGIFNYDYINKLIIEHFSGRKDNHKTIWTLLIFETWMRKWF
ncbi:asparagine synthase (glutamine-hydrolyzing) [Patescibacteria group bacterium]